MKRHPATFFMMLFLPLVLHACGASEQAAPPPRCEDCHKLSSLEAGKTDLPLREWTQEAGRGLVRKDVMMMTDTKQFIFKFPRRGRHDADGGGRCAGCHPASAQGIRHGLIQYPQSARPAAFKPGADCAASCHLWIESERPADLLGAAENGHSRIYREGYRSPEKNENLNVTAINPGCAGCHNVKDEIHGTITECVECHAFGGTGGEIHKAHADAIAERGRDVPACNYCHNLQDDSTDLKNAACYNCHLSGHQPLDPEGKPHFWPK